MVERFAFKVVTPDMQSLGLRKNPHILTFQPGEWLSLPDDQIVQGRGVWGGIWAAAKIGGANTLVKYMADQYDLKCRLFRAQIGKVLYENSYRVKTDRILLVQELSTTHT